MLKEVEPEAEEEGWDALEMMAIIAETLEVCGEYLGCI